MDPMTRKEAPRTCTVLSATRGECGKTPAPFVSAVPLGDLAAAQVRMDAADARVRSLTADLDAALNARLRAAASLYAAVEADTAARQAAR